MMTTEVLNTIYDFTLEEKTNLYILAECLQKALECAESDDFGKLMEDYAKHKRSLLAPLTKEKRKAALEFLKEVKAHEGCGSAKDD